jgi:hypothetical protein
MTESPDNASAANGNLSFRFAAAGLLMLLPVLYVASIGPACRLQSLGCFSETTEMVLTYFYRPIALAVKSSPVVASAFEAYLEWWIP